jgi:hypothetical protein
VTEFYNITALVEQTLDAMDWPSKWTRAAEGEYEDEDLEDIQEQKDDLADKDNEDLNLEDMRAWQNSLPMISPNWSMDAGILNYMAQFIPEGARDLCERSLSVLVTQVKNTLPPSDEEEAIFESRFEFFKPCLSVIIITMSPFCRFCS